MRETLLRVEDIRFLEGLADRLSEALYYGKVEAIGPNGLVSTGLTHDDYDILRALAKRAKLAQWDREHLQ